MQTANKDASGRSGKLRIGDDWNAINIIALSQNNPLKAMAEFVENSIDARARRIVITRGKEKGLSFLRVKDDGEGIRRDADGAPDFRYVATHICDSIKRELKRQGDGKNMQGEFGIGLLSFWTVGEELTLSSAGADGRVYQMHMRKGDPTYTITHRRALVAEPGTELVIRNVLPGVRAMSGEKIQWYLASELRDRIRLGGVDIRVIDRTARAEFKVEPRQFEGRLLHEIGQCASGEVYLELYLNRLNPENKVGLYRNGTRVLENIAELPAFQKAPWTSGWLQGIVDAAYLRLTPGSRTGIIYDEMLARLASELEGAEALLLQVIADQQRAEEEQASRDVLRSIQKAFREALLALPAEEYDWFEVRGERALRRPPQPDEPAENGAETLELREQTPDEASTGASEQKQFFEFPGPLFSLRISPVSSVVPVGGKRTFRAVARDRAQRLVEAHLQFEWQITEGQGRIENETGEIVTFQAPSEPGLTKLRLQVTQGDIECSAEALITITENLVPENKSSGNPRQGLPSYTFQKAPGELWRSKYNPDQNVVIVNNGHRDFVFASRNRALKLRYICRLFAKELVLQNFAGTAPDQLLERMIELSLYTEEHL